MNEFVDYLNSTNNAGSDSTGSLAEAQVKSVFYDRIKVSRKLGTYISNGIRNNTPEAFILTGHAGDGKTSILVQALKESGLLEHQQGLDQEHEYQNFYYVKDMSEITRERQAEVLKRALQAPATGKSSLLISNTGPLLLSFTSLVQEAREQKGLKFGEREQIDLQTALLKQLDKNNDTPITIEGFTFILVNIARVDNVSFSVRILKNIIADDLWHDCGTCKNNERCPIYHNRCLLKDNFVRVSSFIENYYRYLYENDKRMTIRQMVGQLSYALTGNLTCKYINSHYLKSPFFDYNFANLFFGCVGINDNREASQIKGIRQIRNLELDRIALNVDYKLFVNHDYSFFSPEINAEINTLNIKHKNRYKLNEEEVEDSNKVQKLEVQLRRAIRRYYLFYSLFSDDKELDNVFNQVFGSNFMEYISLTTRLQSKQMLRKMQSTIFQALYIKNTGVLPKTQNALPLTLRREDDVFQNVMLVLGSVNKIEMEICQSPDNNRFEDADGKQQIMLRIRDQDFHITLPLLAYFNALINGSIASNNNPALTHGIAKLDARLHDEFSTNVDDNELTVIINTMHGQQLKQFVFEEGKMLID